MGQVFYLLQVGLFIVICGQPHHNCIVNILDDVEVATQLCVQGVQQGAQNTALGCSSVLDEGRGVICNSSWTLPHASVQDYPPGIVITISSCSPFLPPLLLFLHCKLLL